MSLDLQATEERYWRKHDRAVKNFGFASTDEALAISSECMGQLSSAIEARLAAHTLGGNAGFVETARLTDRSVKLLRMISPELVALVTLSCAIQDAIQKEALARTCETVSKLLCHEMFAAELTIHDPKLRFRVERWTKRKHGSARYRLQAARSLAKREGFAWKRGKRIDYVVMGKWCVEVLLNSLPDMFTTDEETGGIAVTEAGQRKASGVLQQFIKNFPVLQPDTQKPNDWTAFDKGGPVDNSAGVSLVRTHHRETIALINAAIKNGMMQPALDGLNAAQATPWRINEKVLDVLIECHEQGIKVGGIPPLTDYPIPKHPGNGADEKALELFFRRANGIRKANRMLIAERLSLLEDVTIAQKLLGGTFYTPCNLDWRGRTYAVTHFNFQREDRVRALFLYSEVDEALGHDGLKWLKVHTANCGDFDKVSKKLFEEREQWTNDNLAKIQEVAQDPLKNLWWTEADKPFLFLAACFEVSAAMSAKDPTEFISSLPVNWDGSCSGLQHLCAMTRAEEGWMVNLTAMEQVQDVYQTVADKAKVFIEEDASYGLPHAQAALNYGVSRKVVKRNVMTYSYSSKTFGMKEQQMEDLMEPLELEVLEGKRESHPFGDEWVQRANASLFLARHVFNAITLTVHKPAEAMGFLQKLAKAMGHHGKPLEWTSPAGIPWSNRYHEKQFKRLTLWMHDKGVRMWVATNRKKEIDKDRAANGVAPNFVHACDASHLLLTVRAAAKEGFKHFALVHDSFGCIGARSERFHQIIREEFVKMYEEHDVLTEVLERAKCDLTVQDHGRLPSEVVKGSLNIKEVLNAKYAFA